MTCNEIAAGVSTDPKEFWTYGGCQSLCNPADCPPEEDINLGEKVSCG